MLSLVARTIGFMIRGFCAATGKTTISLSKESLQTATTRSTRRAGGTIENCHSQIFLPKSPQGV